jgi:hypothetical protein
MGMFRIGAERFKNQFGVIGNSLKNSKKKNKLFLFSSTCSKESSVRKQKGSPVTIRDTLHSLFPTLPTVLLGRDCFSHFENRRSEKLGTCPKPQSR